MYQNGIRKPEVKKKMDQTVVELKKVWFSMPLPCDVDHNKKLKRKIQN